MTLNVPADLTTIELRKGCGSGKEGDRCAIQEYRAWCGLDPAGDSRPEGVCPVLHSMVIGLNDARLEWRRALVNWLPLLANTEGNAATRQARAYKAADWAVRVFAPLALDAKYPEHAAKLRAMAEIVNKETAKAGKDTAYAAAAEAAAYAAEAAAYAAAEAAAYAAAEAAYAAAKIDVIAVLESIRAIWVE
jgi:hypothetical protein